MPAEDVLKVLDDIFKVRDADKEPAHFKALQKTGFWGEQGAGCLFYARDTGRLLVAHRSLEVREPGTWGTWGGAIDRAEEPSEAVEREIYEEAGYTGEVKLHPIWTFKHASGFQYHNFLAVVPHEFEPKLNWETQGSEWVSPGRWPSPLHPGLSGLVERPEFDKLITILGVERK
jgi:8-oxo-dGTP pyrophosphatase MutT (NUDIX family)